MPWHIEQRGNDYCVIKDDDNSVAGCHPTRAQADAQLDALYASEGAKADFREYTYNGVTVQATGRRTAEAEGSKYERTVRRGDTERTVSYGSPDMPMRRTNDEARENFLSRHSCGEKKDPFSAGFWACYDWANPSEKALKADAVYDLHWTLTGERPRLRSIHNTGEPVKATKAGEAAIMLPAGLSDTESDDYQRTYERVFSETGDALKAQLAAIGAVNRRRQGYAVKSVTHDDDGVTIGGWAVLFGSPEHVDSDRQWFSAKTDFQLERYTSAPLWYQHGADPRVQSRVIGYRTKTDVYPQHGIWVEHRLSRDEPGFAVLDFERVVKAVKDGDYAYSSDSLSHHVINGFKHDTGELAVWPLAGISLVDRPAEVGLGPVVAQEYTN